MSQKLLQHVWLCLLSKPAFLQVHWHGVCAAALAPQESTQVGLSIVKITLADAVRIVISA